MKYVGAARGLRHYCGRRHDFVISISAVYTSIDYHVDEMPASSTYIPAILIFPPGESCLEQQHST